MMSDKYEINTSSVCTVSEPRVIQSYTLFQSYSLEFMVSQVCISYGLKTVIICNCINVY